MPEALAEFLDEISLHLEREIAKVPPTLAQALLRDDAPFSTAEMLRILARQETAADQSGRARGAEANDPGVGPTGLSAA